MKKPTRVTLPAYELARRENYAIYLLLGMQANLANSYIAPVIPFEAGQILDSAIAHVIAQIRERPREHSGSGGIVKEGKIDGEQFTFPV